MKTMKKGTIVQTTKGKIGEVVESESWVIKDQNGVAVSDTFSSREVCETYRVEINPDYTTAKVPCLVKLGKNVFPIYSNNLIYLKTIYFNFKDFHGNDVVLRQNQTTGLILKKFLDKSNIKYFMFPNEDELNEHLENKNKESYNVKEEDIFNDYEDQYYFDTNNQ